MKKKPVSLQLCPLQIPHGLAWNLTWPATVRSLITILCSVSGNWFQISYFGLGHTHTYAKNAFLSYIFMMLWLHIQTQMYNLFNKYQAAWYFIRPAQAVTWRTVAIKIWVVLLSLYLCIRGVSMSSVHYNQSRHIYSNQRHQFIRLIWSWNMN